MKIAIVALILAIAALGLGSFATFISLNDDETTATPSVETGWSRGDCARAAEELSDLRWRCILEGDTDCPGASEKIAALNDNCE